MTGTREPRISVYLNVPAARFHRARPFLVDTGSSATVLDASLLKVAAATLGPAYGPGLEVVGGDHLPCHEVTANMKIQATDGVTRDVTPRRVLAIDGPGARHILGTNLLEEHSLRVSFNPARRYLSLVG